MGIDTNTVCTWVRDYRRKNHMPSSAESMGIKQSITKTDKEAYKQLKVTELVMRAMSSGLVNRKPTRRLLFHSDRAV